MTQPLDLASRETRSSSAGSRRPARSGELLAVGITDLIPSARPTPTVIGFRVRRRHRYLAAGTAAGEICAGSMSSSRLIRPVHVPWLPELPGATTFAASRFAQRCGIRDFDPAGKRIAVIGTDATAGHHTRRLIKSAASVTVFAHAPRRFVTEMPLSSTRVKRWLRRHTPRSGATGGRGPRWPDRRSAP